MNFECFCVIMTLSLLAMTQSIPSTVGPSPTIAATATHTIAAGEAGLIYTPNDLVASVGDVIEFRFYPQNHSVARAGYKNPCIPFEYSGVNQVGFWSGFQPVNIVLQDPPKFSIIINDTAPIFFYCSAPGACIENGMIGVINPNATQTFDVQLAFAKNSSLMFSPGEGFPFEANSSSSASAIPLTSPSMHFPLSHGRIAGIVVGTVLAVIVLCLLCFIRRKRRSQGHIADELSNKSTEVTPSLYSPPAYPQLSPAPVSQSIAPERSIRPYPQADLTSPLISPDPTGRFPPIWPIDSEINDKPQELAAFERQ